MKIENIIKTSWESFQKKIANGLLVSENEKMMQLQFAQILQTIAPIFEYEKNESIKVLLEVPVTIKQTTFRSIDIVISHTKSDHTITYYPIELKCFRLYTRSGSGKRGAQNLGMYDYWEDIENIENYVTLPNFQKGFQLTLTDDTYYVNTIHRGGQVAVYSTNINRKNVTGTLEANIANRLGSVKLKGAYNMDSWSKQGAFYFILQTT
jgi:hypothetical protein